MGEMSIFKRLIVDRPIGCAMCASPRRDVDLMDLLPTLRGACWVCQDCADETEARHRQEKKNYFEEPEIYPGLVGVEL